MIQRPIPIMNENTIRASGREPEEFPTNSSGLIRIRYGTGHPATDYDREVLLVCAGSLEKFDYFEVSLLLGHL